MTRSQVEAVARAIHEGYCKHHRKQWERDGRADGDYIAPMPWWKCRAETRAAYRAAARAAINAMKPKKPRKTQMKQPTQREVREMCARNKHFGAYYLVVYNPNGRPEVSRIGTLTLDDAERLLTEWVYPSCRQRNQCKAAMKPRLAKKG